MIKKFFNLFKATVTHETFISPVPIEPPWPNREDFYKTQTTNRTIKTVTFWKWVLYEQIISETVETVSTNP